MWFHVTFDDLCCKQTFKARTLFSAILLYLYELQLTISSSHEPINVISLSLFKTRQMLGSKISKQENKSDFKAKSVAEM